MTSVIQSLICLVLMGLLPAAEANAGWVVEHVTRSQGAPAAGTGRQDRQVFTMSNNRMKTAMVAATGKPESAFIVDLEAQTLSMVDYEKRTVATGAIQEYIEAMRDTMQGMTGQMAEAMKQMQEALKDMPPEQRKMMEQMMGKSMPSGGPAGAPPAEACRQPNTEVRPTGQTARIAGFQAVRYDVLEDGKLTQELWLSKAITAWQEIDLKKLERFSSEMAKAMESLPGCGRGRGRGAGPDPYDPTWKLVSEGYAVRTVSHGRDITIVTEILKAENRAVPLTEFQVPAGFKRQSFKELMQGGA